MAVKAGKETLVLAILLIAVGAGWLLSTLGVVPRVDWAWTLGLAAVGFLTFLLGGWDKVTVVVGPLFIVASCLSIMRQTGRLDVDVEMPILVVIGGGLLLLAHCPAVPVPKWLLPEPPAGGEDKPHD
jgi:hypothetical protein